MRERRPLPVSCQTGGLSEEMPAILFAVVPMGSAAASASVQCGGGRPQHGLWKLAGRSPCVAVNSVQATLGLVMDEVSGR